MSNKKKEEKPKFVTINAKYLNMPMIEEEVWRLHKEGKKLKCPKCEYEWKEEMDATEIAEIIFKTASLPRFIRSIVERKKLEIEEF